MARPSLDEIFASERPSLDSIFAEPKKEGFLQKAGRFIQEGAGNVMAESDMAAEASKVPMSSLGRGLMRGYAKTADTALALANVLHDPSTPSPLRALQEKYTEPAIKHWTSDKQLSPFEQVGEGLGEIGSAVTFGPAAVPVMAGNTTYQTGKDLIEQGATTKQAQQAGAVQGSAMALMGLIPAAGKTVPKTLALAAANPAIGAASRAATQQVLADKPELAAQFDPLDPVALGMDVASAGLSIPAHLRMKRAAVDVQKPVTDTPVESAPVRPPLAEIFKGPEAVAPKIAEPVRPPLAEILDGKVEVVKAPPTETPIDATQKPPVVTMGAQSKANKKTTIKNFEEIVAASDGAGILRSERLQRERSVKVGEWRSKYSDRAEVIASGDIAKSDYQKLGELVDNNQISLNRAVQMIDDATISGVIDPKVGEYIKSKVSTNTTPPPTETPMGTAQKPPVLPNADGNIAAGSLAYGMPLPKYANNINLERVGADYSAKKLILDVSDQYKGAIDEARRGTITLEETKKLADELGMTTDTLLKRRQGQAFNAEEVTAARDILNTSAQRLTKVRDEAAKLGSDEALATFRQALDQHAAIQAEVSGVAAEAGRALSAHRIISSESKNYKAMLDALGGRELNEQILERFAKVDTTNVREVNSFIKEFAKVKTGDMVYEAWINFLLSGPKTHIVNVASNTLTFMTKPLETAVASTLDAVASKVKGRPRERFFGEIPRDIVGGIVGMREGVRAGMKAWDEGLSSDTLIKVENAGKYQAIPGKTGRFIRIPGRALAAADEFFKSINYTAELYGQAYRQAAMDGLKGEARAAKAVEYLSEPTKKMVNAARHEAEYRTFTQPYGKWSKILERTRQIPGVKYIIPFMRTPVNIAKFALERTPLNFARLAHKAAKGELKGAALADEMAKPIIGSMIAIAAVQGVMEGNVTGGGPKDRAARDALYRTGWQPYSLKIGDKYINYSRMEPLSSVFGMAADFTELLGNNEIKNPDDYAEAIALSISKNLTSKTFMKGLSAAFDAMSDPKRYGEQFINNFAGSVIPSAVNTLATMQDDTMRQVDGPAEAIQNRIPFLSEALEPKRDLWGREIKKSGNTIERGFSPFQVTTATNDPVDMEVNRLGLTPGLPSKKINKHELTPVQYDLYVKRAGERAYRDVSRIAPQRMNDDRKRELIDKAIRRARDFERARMAREFNLRK